LVFELCNLTFFETWALSFVIVHLIILKGRAGG
jgi:hypothetical protein